jgi:hypothetical protein
MLFTGLFNSVSLKHMKGSKACQDYCLVRYGVEYGEWVLAYVYRLMATHPGRTVLMHIALRILFQFQMCS